MTTAIEVRPRPAIEPIRTTGPGFNLPCLRGSLAFKSPAWTASPSSPRSLPLPSYQESRDERMRENDKAAVEKLDPRSRRNSAQLDSDLHNVSLRPIVELALPTPNSLPSQRSPLSAPLFASPVYRRSTVVEEARDMLLLYDHETEKDKPPPKLYGRRDSAPPGALAARNMQLLRQREHLRRRGFVGSYRPREADLLVMPVELRRLSTLPATRNDLETLAPSAVSRCLTTRVVVHSRGRKPVVLTRTFDLDELRATLTRPSSVDGSDPGRASVATLQPPPSATCISSPGLPIERRHSYGALPGLGAKRARSSERRGSRQGLSPVPVRKLPYMIRK